MSTAIYTKSLRDRWVSTTVGMLATGLMLVLAMAAYQQIGTELYAELPESMRSIMGIPDGADPAALAYSVMLGMIGALTLAGLALSAGASSIAGEERDGTLAVLLANPRSRRAVLGSKLGAMWTLTAVGGLVIAGASWLAPSVLGVEIGATHVGAGVLHLAVNALLWGSVATAIGAVTGNRTTAAAGTGGLMVLSYFLVGLLPLAPSTAGLARVVPWYWFDGHDPLTNGVSPGYLAAQVGAIVLLTAVAWWGVEARDLTRPTGGRSLLTTLVDRLQGDPRAARVLERLQGRARVGGIFARTLGQGRALLVVVSTILFAMMGLMMGAIYTALSATLAEVSASLPEAMLAFVGGGDMSTPEGWYQLETFGLMAPVATILVAVAAGARALAGEERDRTMGLLLANPVARRAVVLRKAAAMAVHTAVTGLALFAGVLGGSLLGGLGMSVGNIAAASLQATLLGLLFGTLALAVGAASGEVRRARVATTVAVGVAYLANALLSLGGDLSRWAWVSPFDWYLGGEPLTRGFDWAGITLLGALAAVLLGVAVVLFDRRDLRHG